MAVHNDKIKAAGGIATSDGNLLLLGSSDVGAPSQGNTVTLTWSANTGNRTLTLPNATGRPWTLVYASTAASTAVTGATETETNFDTFYTLGAGVPVAGTRIRIKATVFHTATTGSETHDLLIKLGTTTIGSVTGLDPADNAFSIIEYEGVFRTVGASGTFVGSGRITTPGVRGAVSTAASVMSGSAGTSTATIDTTAANVIAIAIDRQGTATDGDSCRLDEMAVWLG